MKREEEDALRGEKSEAWSYSIVVGSPEVPGLSNLRF